MNVETSKISVLSHRGLTDWSTHSGCQTLRYNRQTAGVSNRAGRFFSFQDTESTPPVVESGNLIQFDSRPCSPISP